MGEPAQQLVEQPTGTSLVRKFAAKFNVEDRRLLQTLKDTCFRQPSNKPAPTDEQMAALLVVADQYELNPFTREIYAFPQDGGIVPVVGLDGWARIINAQAEFDGMDFEDVGDEIDVVADGEDHKPCPEGIACIIHRKDREHPTRVVEYLEECYQPPKGQNKRAGPWQTHTRRMLRHKAMIQCARLAFGFVGIYDEDEGRRILDADITVVGSEPANDSGAEMADTLKPVVEDAEFDEVPDVNELLGMVEKATSSDDLDVVRDLNSRHMNEGDKGKVTKAINAKATTLDTPAE